MGGKKNGSKNTRNKHDDDEEELFDEKVEKKERPYIKKFKKFVGTLPKVKTLIDSIEDDNAHEIIKLSDEKYVILVVHFNKKCLLTVIDYKDYKALVKISSGPIIMFGNYVGYTDTVQKKRRYLHDFVMENSKIARNDKSDSIDHINQWKYDNRLCNLRYTTQNYQNSNTNSKERGSNLDRCDDRSGIKPKHIPQCVSYFPPRGNHLGDGFELNIKYPDFEVRWGGTKDSEKSLAFKLELIKGFIRFLSEKHEKVADMNILGNNPKSVVAMKKFNSIIEASTQFTKLTRFFKINYREMIDQYNMLNDITEEEEQELKCFEYPNHKMKFKKDDEDTEEIEDETTSDDKDFRNRYSDKDFDDFVKGKNEFKFMLPPHCCKCAKRTPNSQRSFSLDRHPGVMLVDQKRERSVPMNGAGEKKLSLGQKLKRRYLRLLAMNDKYNKYIKNVSKEEIEEIKKNTLDAKRRIDILKENGMSKNEIEKNDKENKKCKTKKTSNRNKKDDDD